MLNLDVMPSHDQASQNAWQQMMSPRASFTSELARSAFEAVSLRDGYMPTRSPKRSCRTCGTSADASATTHPESGQARVRSGSAARFADASPPPVTPAWLQSPGHLRRPGDFRSYCHAPARLWPSESSTDSLDPTHQWPARGARLFQTGALLPHLKGKAVTVGSRQTLHFSPWRSFVPGFASVNRAGSSPPSLPREVQ